MFSAIAIDSEGLRFIPAEPEAIFDLCFFNKGDYI